MLVAAGLGLGLGRACLEPGLSPECRGGTKEAPDHSALLFLSTGCSPGQRVAAASDLCLRHMPSGREMMVLSF